MKVPKNTPTKSIKIAGVQVAVPAPFAEGHALSATEAKVLNQTLSENIRNNCAAAVKKLLDAGKEKEVQSSVDSYFASYEFGVRVGGGGGGSKDPVEKEAMRIARELVRTALQKAGHKLADVSGAKVTELAAKALEKRPEIRAQAKVAVEKRASIGLEELGIGKAA